MHTGAFNQILHHFTLKKWKSYCRLPPSHNKTTITATTTTITKSVGGWGSTEMLVQVDLPCVVFV